MIALSVRQPWCWAILHAGKRIENRDWRTSFRGRVLLHASKGCTREEYEDSADFIRDAEPGLVVPLLAELPRGALVGAMTITGCVEVHIDALGDAVPSAAIPVPQLRWACGPYGLLLADMVALPRPVPCKGALGFWRVPQEVADEVRAMADGGDK